MIKPPSQVQASLPLFVQIRSVEDDTISEEAFFAKLHGYGEQAICLGAALAPIAANAADSCIGVATLLDEDGLPKMLTLHRLLARINDKVLALPAASGDITAVQFKAYEISDNPDSNCFAARIGKTAMAFQLSLTAKLARPASKKKEAALLPFGLSFEPEASSTDMLYFSFYQIVECYYVSCF